VDGYSCAKLAQLVPALPEPHFETTGPAPLSSGLGRAKDKEGDDVVSGNAAADRSLGRASGELWASQQRPEKPEQQAMSAAHNQGHNETDKAEGGPSQTEGQASSWAQSQRLDRLQDRAEERKAWPSLRQGEQPNRKLGDSTKSKNNARQPNLLGTGQAKESSSPSNEINRDSQQWEREEKEQQKQPGVSLGSFGSLSGTSGGLPDEHREWRLRDGKARRRRGDSRRAKGEEEWRRGTGKGRHAFAQETQGKPQLANWASMQMRLRACRNWAGPANKCCPPAKSCVC